MFHKCLVFDKLMLHEVRRTHFNVTHLRTRGTPIREDLPDTEGSDAKPNVQPQDSFGFCLVGLSDATNVSGASSWVFAFFPDHSRLKQGEMHGYRRDRQWRSRTIVIMTARRHWRQSTTNFVWERRLVDRSWKEILPNIGRPTDLTSACRAFSVLRSCLVWIVLILW